MEQKDSQHLQIIFQGNHLVVQYLCKFPAKYIKSYQIYKQYLIMINYVYRKQHIAMSVKPRIFKPKWSTFYTYTHNDTQHITLNKIYYQIYQVDSHNLSVRFKGPSFLGTTDLCRNHLDFSQGSSPVSCSFLAALNIFTGNFHRPAPLQNTGGSLVLNLINSLSLGCLKSLEMIYLRHFGRSFIIFNRKSDDQSMAFGLHFEWQLALYILLAGPNSGRQHPSSNGYTSRCCLPFRIVGLSWNKSSLHNEDGLFGEHPLSLEDQPINLQYKEIEHGSRCFFTAGYVTLHQKSPMLFV